MDRALASHSEDYEKVKLAVQSSTMNRLLVFIVTLI